MKKSAWARRIKSACIEAGTYQPFFDPAISTLSEILEKRDAIETDYKRLGEKPVIVYTNKGGKSNPVKNPLLVLWAELNKDALAYWRDLGLTPAGYKRINEKPAAKTETFESVLAALSD